MSLTINDQDKRVAELLQAWGVEYDAVYTGPRTDNDGWDYDGWVIIFDSETFDFRTGTGHRVEPPKMSRRYSKQQMQAFRELRELTKCDRATFPIDREESRSYSVRRAVMPTQASVLYCLFRDAQCGAELFADFCSELGYDEDSRKAFRAYEACQKIAKQLRQLFTNAQIEELEEVLQDY
jgi:hypothetical protein